MNSLYVQRHFQMAFACYGLCEREPTFVVKKKHMAHIGRALRLDNYTYLDTLQDAIIHYALCPSMSERTHAAAMKLLEVLVPNPEKRKTLLEHKAERIAKNNDGCNICTHSNIPPGSWDIFTVVNAPNFQSLVNRYSVNLRGVRRAREEGNDDDDTTYSPPPPPSKRVRRALVAESSSSEEKEAVETEQPPPPPPHPPLIIKFPSPNTDDSVIQTFNLRTPPSPPLSFFDFSTPPQSPKRAPRVMENEQSPPSYGLDYMHIVDIADVDYFFDTPECAERTSPASPNLLSEEEEEESDAIPNTFHRSFGFCEPADNAADYLSTMDPDYYGLDVWFDDAFLNGELPELCKVLGDMAPVEWLPETVHKLGSLRTFTRVLWRLVDMKMRSNVFDPLLGKLVDLPQKRFPYMQNVLKHMIYTLNEYYRLPVEDKWPSKCFSTPDNDAMEVS
jgi:hypothetical protein